MRRFPLADSAGFLSPQNKHMDIRKPNPDTIDIIGSTGVPPFPQFYAGDAAVEYQRQFSRTVLELGLHEIRKPSDVLQEGVGVVFCMQHTPADITPEHLRLLSAFGVRFMALAYAKATPFGGGYQEDAPLTPRGKELLLALYGWGITADLSHLGPRMALDVLEYTYAKLPGMKPMLSHSACSAVHPHPRNASDEVLRGVANAEGYVGIPVLSPFLGPQGSDPFVQLREHLAHAARICGPDLVGIGSDSQHFDMTMDEERAIFDYMSERVPNHDMYWPTRHEAIVTRGSWLMRVLDDALTPGITERGRRLTLGSSYAYYLLRALPS